METNTSLNHETPHDGKPMLAAVLLRHIKPGQFVEVISNGKGLLRNITVGRHYEVTKVSVKTQRFFFRNDLNKPASYHLKSNCWFRVSNTRTVSGCPSSQIKRK